MNLKRKDTLENRAFWESVERAEDDWRKIKPEWAKSEEEKRYDLFLVLVYFATQQGEKAVDMPRNVIATAFFRGYLEFLEAPLRDRAFVARKFDSPAVDWVEFNKILLDALKISRTESRKEILLTLYELLKFKRREYTGPPESEVWYESSFEEYLKNLNKTRGGDFAMSVKDARRVETVLARMSPEEKETLKKVASAAANLLDLI